MSEKQAYPIGTKGEKWQQAEVDAWRATTSIKRSYQDQVQNKLSTLPSEFERIQYGALSYDQARYPLFALKSKQWDPSKINVLVTGGVHGYETSGVQGAILFLQQYAAKYLNKVNLLIAPCVSPWGYETINRWNPNAVDPNRSFYADSPSEEASKLMQLVASIEGGFALHIDLHETTDTDESEFRPALAARDGKPYVAGSVPDGFYLVGDSENPQAEFQKAVINEVSKVTHIAPADTNGQLIGVDIEQFGVINYSMKALGLCGGMTNSQFSTTTEVYPDSPKVDDDNCNRAQVAAIVGAIEHLLLSLGR